jgi:hypothetical protein
MQKCKLGNREAQYTVSARNSKIDRLILNGDRRLSTSTVLSALALAARAAPDRTQPATATRNANQNQNQGLPGGSTRPGARRTRDDPRAKPTQTQTPDARQSAKKVVN